MTLAQWEYRMKPRGQRETTSLSLQAGADSKICTQRRARLKRRCLLQLAAAAMLLTVRHVPAQGTAFTYQGRLNEGGSPANGVYDIRASLYLTNSGGTVFAGPLTNPAVAVSNGLFTITLDYGSVFEGATYWLQIGVRSNNVGGFTILSPRQQLTPTPYALFANTSSNLSGTVSAAQLSGTVGNGQLANSAISINAGTGLSGGGTVALGGSTTLNNTGVLSVTGNADITVSTVGGAVTLGDTATSADTASTIVRRDTGGNFSAASITLDGNLNLPTTTATTGIIYSGAGTLVHAYGVQDFFAGPSAGNLTTSGNGNTGLGYLALSSIVDGSGNTASGAYALNFNTSGTHNTANGYHALYSNTTGSENTASGRSALHNNTTGTQNTADGVQALNLNSSGSNNTAMGYQALYSNSNGIHNTAVGYRALVNNTTGSENTANGRAALYNNTTGAQNTAGGAQALNFNSDGNHNTANGYQALFSSTSASDNTANGYQALYSNTSGYQNTANGSQALYFNTSGYYNTANGYQALNFNTSGFENTANGYQALSSSTGGSDNTANGFAALLSLTTGDFNTANGMDALRALTSGDDNTADGVYSLGLLTVGNHNTALGYEAGVNVTSGTNNIEIGNAGAGSDNQTIRLGDSQTSTFIAGIYNSTVTAAQVYVNANGRLGIFSSSRRYKDNIQTLGEASAALYALRPVTFKYKPGIDSGGVPQFGLIAEEVNQVDPDLVVHDEQHGIYTVRYEAVNVMLLNEFLKEHRKVQAQEMEIGEQTTELQELHRRIDAQNSVNAQLNRRLEALEKIVLERKLTE